MLWSVNIFLQEEKRSSAEYKAKVIVVFMGAVLVNQISEGKGLLKQF